MMTTTQLVRDVHERGTARVRRVTLTLAGIVLAALIASLFIGEYQLTLVQMLNTLIGNAPEPLAEFMIMGRRLPRAIVAILVGAALAIAGATFQRMTRNPLASPDLIGISGGASAGGALVMMVFGGSLAWVSVGAIIGALTAASFIGLVALRSKGFSSRVVLVGIAIATLSSATVSYLLTQVFVAKAVTAQTWLIGTLQGRGWAETAPVLMALAIAVPVLAATSSHARMIELGDDAARSLGVKVGAVRTAQLAAATLVAAAAVAVAGPISFVALASGHIARALVGRATLWSAALVGALVLLVSDLLAQHALPLPIPVGVVTIVFGGGFLLWLLLRERKNHG